MENAATSSIKPKFGRVLIKREITKKTAGGIYIPENAAKRHAACEGIIVGLGETAGFTETYIQDEGGNWVPHVVQTLKVGQRVQFGRHSGTWLDGKLNDKGEDTDEGTLFLCQDQDILTEIERAA